MRPVALLVLLTVLVAAAVPKAAPSFWRTATMADFLKGELDQLAVDEHGRVTIGPTIARVFDAQVPFVWTAVATTDGATLLGTGNDGKVFRVEAGGAGRVLYDASEPEVHAVLPTSDGGAYVATSPDGRVYEVERDGSARTFFDPDEKYIWALATDEAGRLLVATGDPKGRVYRVASTGAGEAIATTTSTHVITLAFDGSRRLLFGTEGPGRVFRVEGDGKAFLLLDTSLQEVRAIRVDPKGRIYVVAQARRGAGVESGGTEITPTLEPVRSTPVATVTAEITAMAVVEPSGPALGAQSASGAGRSAAGAVFRIDADGTWDRVWESGDDVPYDIAFESDGAMLVATGHRGRLYRLTGEPAHASLVGRTGSQQAVQLLPAGGRTLVALSNPGALVRVEAGHADRGTYVSSVHDAKSVSTWGAISWRAVTVAGARLEVSTRSGNSPTPDEAWSAWSSVYVTADGSPIGSPSGRYLQWRAVLTGASSPALTSVTAAYLPRNQRPVVSGVVAHPPGVVFQKPFSTGEAEIAGFAAHIAERRLANQGQPSPSTGAPTLGRRTYQKGLQTIVWKGDDANGDDLTFDVHFRREGDTAWHTLTTGLEEAIYVWDTATVPSGLYVVKVVASDAPSQTSRTALTGEAESTVIEVDNIAPVLTVRPARREGTTILVPVDVRDEQSAIGRIEYSVNGGPWVDVLADDGLLDGRNEQVTLRFDAAAVARDVVVRAEDTLHNVGVAHAPVRP